MPVRDGKVRDLRFGTADSCLLRAVVVFSLTTLVVDAVGGCAVGTFFFTPGLEQLLPLADH